jgi:hypothetical protein
VSANAQPQRAINKMSAAVNFLSMFDPKKTRMAVANRKAFKINAKKSKLMQLT